MMTPEIIAELKAASEAATKRPWNHTDDEDCTHPRITDPYYGDCLIMSEADYALAMLAANHLDQFIAAYESHDELFSRLLTLIIEPHNGMIAVPQAAFGSRPICMCVRFIEGHQYYCFASRDEARAALSGAAP